MSRDFKRVPMSFAWPLKKPWIGYAGVRLCPRCMAYKDVDDCKLCDGEMYVRTPRTEPPQGNGWQLWETTSEGSPASPVFATLDELCEWCAANATLWASLRANQEEWKKFATGWTYTADLLNPGKIEWFENARDAEAARVAKHKSRAR